MAIPMQKTRVGDIDIEFDVADYTDPWDDREPETILFHHGFCRNLDFWRGWVPQLARHYRVLRFNSRGCGGTTTPPAGAPYEASMLVGDALGLMDSLGIKRAHWVGESSGGILGIVAALTHPERLHSLVLVNTPFKLPGAVMETYNLGEPDHASAIEKHGVGGWCRETLGYRLDLKKAPPAMQEWVIREMGKVANHVGIAHHLMAAGGDMTKRITEIKMPILIMFGENSPLSKKEQMDEMKSKLPNAKLVMFEGYGHGINLLIPDRCVEAMEKFLGEHKFAG
jgi:3-oxoadipate enol-lactonase